VHDAPNQYVRQRMANKTIGPSRNTLNFPSIWLPDIERSGAAIQTRQFWRWDSTHHAMMQSIVVCN